MHSYRRQSLQNLQRLEFEARKQTLLNAAKTRVADDE